MLILKRLGWILLGIVIGVGSTMAPRVRAQERAAQPQTVIQHGDINFGPNQWWLFVSDSKTHSCWLAAKTQSAVTALAPAPPEACQ